MTLRVFEASPMTGFSVALGKAYGEVTGLEAEDLLQARGIDINGPIPLRETTETATWKPLGVVKMSNIPFTVTAQEVVQFMQRFTANAPFQKHDGGYPLHIIMEKPTGKTMDCFVEFPDSGSAAACVNRFDESNMQQKHRIGARHVCLDLSNQAELMSNLFPRARSVKWDQHTGRPLLEQPTPGDFYADSFRGYFTLEEIFGLVKFAETPTRSPFAAKCPQRVYESLISTLHKFPWAATSTYTIEHRNMLFSAVADQLSLLISKVGHLTQATHFQSFKSDKREIGLSQELLMDLMRAGLHAKAFSLLQRHALCQIMGSLADGVDLHEFAWCWPFQTLEPDEVVSPASLKFWLELYDTGFDIAQHNDLKTNLEQYCKVSRNEIGFPIVEWTSKGIGLTFADAIHVEKAVVGFYFDKGRLQWSFERNVTCCTFTKRAWENVAREMPVLGQRTSGSNSSDVSPKDMSLIDIPDGVILYKTPSQTSSDASRQSSSSSERDSLVLRCVHSKAASLPEQQMQSISLAGPHRRLSSGDVYASPFPTAQPPSNSNGHVRSKSIDAQTKHYTWSPTDKEILQFSTGMQKSALGSTVSCRSSVSSASTIRPLSRVASRTASRSRRQVSIDHTIHEHEHGQEQEYEHKSELKYEHDQGVKAQSTEIRAIT